MSNVARLFLLAPLAAGAIAIAPGCSSSKPPIPQSAADVEVIPGQNGSASCAVAIPDNVWNIGGGADGNPIADGDTQSGAGVHVTCSVSGNDSSGYQVSGDIVLDGKGSVTVIGHFTNDTTQPQQNISATFVLSGGLGRWQATDCTATYPTGGGIAPGRVWAQIECATMTDPNHTPPSKCDGIANIRLENCNQ